MIPRHCIGLAAAILSVTAAHAADCPAAGYVDAYRQAEAALAQRDVAGAVARFRPLAEQGLGPAQRRLGELLGDGQGVAADSVEAYRWLALARDAGVPGSGDGLARLEPRLTTAQRDSALAAARGWQPVLGPCLAVDPVARRAEGATRYDFAAVVNRVGAEPSATDAPPRRLAWLMRNLESVRRDNPRYLIYFKSLYAVVFTGKGPFVAIDSHEGQPVLLIDERLLDDGPSDQLKTLIAATVTAVHQVLMPPPTPAVETVTYKARVIRAQASEQGRQFLAMIKQGIDMAETLPPELARLARGITDLRFEPRGPYDKRGGALVTGEYRRDPANGQGYMSYAENVGVESVSRVAINLVGGGIYQRRNQELGDARLQRAEAQKHNAPADIARAEQRVADLEKVVMVGRDPAAYKRGECELRDYEIRTMEALKLDPRDINAAYRARTAWGCG